MALIAATLAAAGVAVGAGSPTSENGDSESRSGREVLQDAQEREGRRRAHRDSPAGREERDRSRTAYRDQSAPEAHGTARSKFPNLIGPWATRWPALGETAELKRYLSDNAALVETADGSRAIVESVLPLRGREPSGDQAPIDLALTGTGDAFAPKSSPTRVRVPRDLNQTLRFPDSSFSVRLAGARASSADLTYGKAFYANALEDTDLVLQATALGAEASLVMRSPDSPTQPALDFDLAPGQRLRLVAEHGVRTGEAEIVDGDERVALIGPALAVDAQGEGVRVTYRVSGKRLVMALDLDDSVAYPVAVDPVIYEKNEFGRPLPPSMGASWFGWQLRSNTTSGMCQGGARVFWACAIGDATIWVKAYQQRYESGDFAEWLNYARSGAYVFRFDTQDLSHNEMTWPGPYTYAFNGIWRADQGWMPGTWATPDRRTNGPWAGYDYGQTAWAETRYYCVNGQAPPVGHCTADGPSSNSGALGNAARFGIAFETAGTPSMEPYVTVNGAAVYKSDNSAPRVASVSHSAAVPPGWVENYSDTAGVTAIDNGTTGLGPNEPGMGMGSVTVAGGDFSQTQSTCGRYNNYGGCPTNWPAPGIAYTAPEGRTTYRATAKDIIDNQSVTADTVAWDVKIDRTAPTFANLGNFLGANDVKWVNEGPHTFNLPQPQDAGSGVKWEQLLTQNEGDRPSSDVVRDAFARTSGSGWGSSERGGAWRYLPGPQSDFTIAGDEGNIASDSNQERLADLPATRAKNVDVKAEFRLPISTTGTTAGDIVTRRQAGSSAGAPYTRIGLRRLAGGQIYIGGSAKIPSGSTSPMFASTNTGLTMPVGSTDTFMMRLRYEGNQVRVRAWRTGTAEPSTWQVQATDNVGPQTAGSVGVQVWQGTGARHTVGFGDIVVRSLDPKVSKDWREHDCNTVSPECGRNPGARSFTWDTRDYNEGPVQFTTRATDPQGNPDAAAPATHLREQSFTVNLDRSKPELALSGPLKDAEGQNVYRDNLRLHMEPKDGDASSPSTKRSGMQRLELWVDRSGPTDPADAQWSNTCGDSCPDGLPKDYDFDATQYGQGQHQITVRAVDKVGNSTEKTVTVLISSDAVKPGLQLSGGLYSLNPTGRDLRAAATDGSAADPQSGVKSIELRIDKNADGDVDDANEQEGIESQPRCNSCPLDLDYQLPVGFSEGAHKAQVKVLDHAGNETVKRWTFYVVDLLPGSRSRLGLEDWFEYDSTPAGGDSRVHVNAETGNTVWHSVPIVNPGRGLSTFVNLTYNSLDRGGILGSTLGRLPLVDASGLNLSQESPGMGYAEAGQGFSISVSGPTRVNEPLGGVELAQIKSYLKRTGEIGTEQDWIAYLQQNFDIPVSDSTPLGDQVTLTDADGTVHTFQRGDDGKWIRPAGLDMHLREYADGPAELPALPASRITPVEKKWAMTRSDGVTHFFDSLGYLRETQDRNGNKLRYEYERYDALTGQGTDSGNVSCAVRPIGEVTDGVLCAMRLRRVFDPAGVEADPGQAGEASRKLTIDYKSGGLLTTQQLPFESPVPFPGLLNGKAGRIEAITDHAGRKLAFEYDDDGMLTKLTEADGQPERRITRFEWEAKQEGLLNDPDDDLDDGLGQDRQLAAVVEVRDASGDGKFAPGEGESDHSETKIGYETRACALGPLCPFMPGVLGTPRKVNRVENRRGFATAYEYRQGSSATRQMDATAQLDKAVPTPASAKTTYTVDDRGRPISIADPTARRTDLAWTPDNRVQTLTAGAGSAEQSSVAMAYNGNGYLTARTTYPNGVGGAGARTLSLEYRDGPGTYLSGATGIDDAGGTFVSDLKTVTNPKPGTGSRFTLDSRGNVTHRYDAEDNVAVSTYDAFGRVTEEVDEAGNKTRYELFHPTGQPQRVIAPREADAGGAGQHTTSYCYDAVGNPTRVTDPRGGSPGCSTNADLPFSTRVGYDALDRMTLERVPLDSSGADPGTADYFSRTKTYDRNGNVLSATDGEGQTTTISYTKMDQPKLVDAPGSDGREKTGHGYDGMDRLIRRTDPKGTPVEDDTSDAAAPFTTTYELDAAGRPVAEVRHSPGSTPASLVTSRAYDARGNVVGINDPRRNQGKTLEQAVAAANPASNPRLTVSYNRDDEAIAEVERPTEAGSAPLIKKFAYDANGNRTAETDPRGGGSDPLSPGDPRYTTTTTYDHRDQVIERKEPTAGAGGDVTHATMQYVRRCDGKVIAETSPRGVANGATETVTGCGKEYTAYKYFTKRFTYDRNGDLASRSIPFAPAQYGRTDAQLAEWKVTYQRDRAGNPTTITDARGKSFSNSFYDSGDLRTTDRPSWWKLDWAEDQRTPDSGVNFRADGDGLEPDTSVPAGGPRLSEREERSANAENPDDADSLPSSEGPAGNFGEVDPEGLPDLLPRAGVTSFDYDRVLRLTGVTDVADKTRVLAYDAAGRLKRKEWPFKTGNNIVHAYAYDANGNLDTVRDGENAVTKFDYDGYDRRVTETAPGAKSVPGGGENTEVTNLTYDANGNLTARETPRGSATTTPTDDYAFRFTPDSLDRVTSEVNPEGDTWSYTYDAAGNRTRERSPRGNTAQAPAHGREAFDTDYEYDAAGRLRKVTDGLDQVTSFEYDADGNRTKVTSPGAASGPGGSVQDRVTEFEADGRGLPWKEKTGSGSDTRTLVREFDPNGNLRRLANPKAALDSEAEDNGTDTDANLKDATLHATVRLYDEDDLLTDIYQPWGKRPDGEDDNRYRQTFERDARGRVTSIFAPHALGDTSVAQTSYGHFDTDWISSYSVEEVQDPNSPTRIRTDRVEYDYDKRGNQTRWATRNRDDSRGRLITRSFFPNGTLEQRTATKVKEDGSEDTTKRSYQYFYNRNRSLVRMVDDDPGRTDNPERTTLLSRDDAEREEIVNETWTQGKDTRFVYDAGGNVTRRQTDGRWSGSAYVDSDGGRGDAKTTDFSYDALDRETEAAVDQGGDKRTTERSWWPSGEQRRKTSQRSGESDEKYVTEDRYWSVHGQTSQMVRDHRGTSSADKDLTYTYDENGNRTKDERGEHRFNSRDQHVWWKRAKKDPGTEVTYSFTPFGAIDKKTDTALDPGKQEIDYVYRGTRLEEVEEAEVRSIYSYDDFGSVVKVKQEPKVPAPLPPVGSLPDLPETCGELDTDPNTTRYCFDEFERMVAGHGPGLKDPAVYTYDGLDRRDSKTTKSATGEQVRDYAYVGSSRMLSREQDRQGKTRYYDYSAAGQREGQAVATSSTSTDPSTYRSYGSDANGSVEELEEPDGSVKPGNEYSYDPYGELDRGGDTGADPEDALGAEARDNPFRYEGFYYDSGVKTYDMQARQYRPSDGMFLSQDRYASGRGDLTLQSDPLTQNRYAFAGGNPVNNVEFDGHCGSFCRQIGKGGGARKHGGGGVSRSANVTVKFGAPVRGWGRFVSLGGGASRSGGGGLAPQRTVTRSQPRVVRPQGLCAAMPGVPCGSGRGVTPGSILDVLRSAPGAALNQTPGVRDARASIDFWRGLKREIDEGDGWGAARHFAVNLTGAGGRGKALGAVGKRVTGAVGRRGGAPAAGANAAARATGRMNPSDVRFSQDSVKSTFSDGRTIDQLAAGLRSGHIDPGSIPPVRLVRRNDEIFSLDNRRLEAFRRAGVDIPYRWATPGEAAAGRRKFSTQNHGQSIRIRGN